MGTPSAEQESSVMRLNLSLLRKITILNISASVWKVSIVFVICFVFISGLLMYTVFNYMTKFQEFEQIDISLEAHNVDDG